MIEIKQQKTKTIKFKNLERYEKDVNEMKWKRRRVQKDKGDYEERGNRGGELIKLYKTSNKTYIAISIIIAFIYRIKFNLEFLNKWSKYTNKHKNQLQISSWINE